MENLGPAAGRGSAGAVKSASPSADSGSAAPAGPGLVTVSDSDNVLKESKM